MGELLASTKGQGDSSKNDLNSIRKKYAELESDMKDFKSKTELLQ